MLEAIFDLLEKENIDRACFYHLAYVGRADGKRVHDVAPEQTKLIISQICDRTTDMYSRGLKKEILTVDNHADGVYVYNRVRRDQPERVCCVETEAIIRGGGLVLLMSWATCTLISSGGITPLVMCANANLGTSGAILRIH